jgi:hypothetical protein
MAQIAEAMREQRGLATLRILDFRPLDADVWVELQKCLKTRMMPARESVRLQGQCRTSMTAAMARSPGVSRRGETPREF